MLPGDPAGVGRQGMVWHGFPEAFADGFLTLQSEDVGQPGFISGEVEEILGRPALTNTGSCAACWAS